jgi:hypothetical protein
MHKSHPKATPKPILASKRSHLHSKLPKKHSTTRSPHQKTKKPTRTNNPLTSSPRLFSTTPETPTQTVPNPPPNGDSSNSPTAPQATETKQLTEHVFFRVDTLHRFFWNHITVSFPDHTPNGIVQETTKALQYALKNRPDCQNYAQNRLPPPKFEQFGANWNRWEWSIRQREIDGALDPMLITTIILDHFHNNLNAVYKSSSSSSSLTRESVTHVLQFPVDSIDERTYIGSYHDTIYDQDGCSV